MCPHVWAGQGCREQEISPSSAPVRQGMMVLAGWHGVLGCGQGGGEDTGKQGRDR